MTNNLIPISTLSMLIIFARHPLSLTVMDMKKSKECGACHFAYQLGLLSPGSQDKTLAGLENHFREVIELSPGSKKALISEEEIYNMIILLFYNDDNIRR